MKRLNEQAVSSLIVLVAATCSSKADVRETDSKHVQTPIPCLSNRNAFGTKRRITRSLICCDSTTAGIVSWLDPENAKLTEVLRLPSGGDTSYAGMIWHEGLLWISYYSSHEGKTSIYLAKVKIPVIE